MIEYDRLYRASAKPARLRLFLFPANPSSAPPSFGSAQPKSERQWFVDALNSVQIQPLEDSSPQGGVAADASNPDFLFGFDKGFQQLPPQDAMPPPKVAAKDVTAGSDCGSEDRHLVGEQAEMQRQIQELQRMQISTHEQACQAMFNRAVEEGVPRTFPGEFYTQKAPEKIPPTAQAPIPIPVPMPITASYYSDRHITTAGYPVTAPPGTEQPVYFMYQQAPPTMRTMTGQMGQAYYGMQRMAAPPPQPVYSAMQQPQPQQKVGVYNEAIGMVQQKVAVAVPEQGYAQVGYDSSGRQVYYASAGGVVPQQYQAAPDGRQMNPEGKVAVKTPCE